MTKIWSQEDIEYLIANYQTHSAKDISDHLNRSVQSIYQKSNKLKLKNKVEKSIDFNMVHQMHVVEGKTLSEIAKLIGVSFGHLSNILPGEFRKKNRHRKSLNKGVLVELYHDQKLSLKGIAEKFNIDPSTVLRMMKEHGLEIRNTYENNVIELDNREILNLYQNGLSCTQISNKLGVSHTTISNRIQSLNIELREHSFYVSGEKSNTWKGGITPDNVKARNSDEYKIWRRMVFERDNFKCVACGDSTGGNLHAHHIENFSDKIDRRYELENGATLCERCHDFKYEGSFHNIYGTRNNTLTQLNEFLKFKRSDTAELAELI